VTDVAKACPAGKKDNKKISAQSSNNIAYLFTFHLLTSNRAKRKRADLKEISQWLILGRSQLERGTVGYFSEGASLQGSNQQPGQA
jgi:hypothetical protein